MDAPAPELVTVAEPAERTGPTSPPARGGTGSMLPGLAVATTVGLAATAAGQLVPAVGGPVIAVVSGLVLATVLGHRPAWVPGIRYTTHAVLKAAIVLLGFGISLGTVVATVRSSGLVMLGTLTAGLGGTVLVGRLLGIRGDRRTLIGVGTSICGASAIAATAGAIEPEDDDVAYAITVIFVFNVAAVLTFPLLGHALGMSPSTFGLWAGTAVNDMSSVVAATAVFGHGALHTGVVVKLARTLMIIPVTAFLAARRSRATRLAGGGTAGRLDLLRRVPLFLVLFLLASLVRTTGLVGAHLAAAGGQVSTLLITVALAAVGLSARTDHIRSAGLRPLVFGGALWVVVAGTSLGLQAIH
ncbi:MAG: putative sulfate exporter family transporter [Actinomycetota bacterium]|jgi:uncharacterized integral membrane protein (TIGR00698 family)|nr:putative sulfate exporter family transporter [Actinomycetota bacterium]